MTIATPASPAAPSGDALEVPELRRLSYFHGQFLGAQDLRREQAYFREKLKLHHRCLHGYGVVCGLAVTPAPPAYGDPDLQRRREELDRHLEELQQRADAAPKQAGGARNARGAGRGNRANETAGKELAALETEIEETRRELEALRGPAGQPRPGRARVQVGSGLALDCDGNELVVREPFVVDLWRALSPADRARFGSGPRSVHVGLCYCEQPVEPARPALLDACGTGSDCAYAWLRDAVKVRVTLDPPDPDRRCDTCCEPCEPGGECVALARVDGVRPEDPVTGAAIDPGVRRPLGRFVPTTITGISWRHGAAYTRDQVAGILGTDDPHGGLEVRFSGPVHTATLREGVVDLFLYEGGRGFVGEVKHVQGEFVDLPGDRFTDRFRYRHSGDERFNPGDRLLVVIRAAFVLDRCCRPLDGTHVGGLVPLIDGYKPGQGGPPPLPCPTPPSGTGAWTSGSGTPGGSFESWFFVRR
jgi:hypothetical protein